MSPARAVRSFCKSEELSRENTHDFVTSELLESLKQEMLPVVDLLAEKQSPMLRDYVSLTAPLEKRGEIALRNTSLKISLLN